MKGKITKTEQGWMVEYKVDEKTPIGHKSWWEKILLHPDDVKQIEEDAKIFDNIEARIKAYPDVEFEIVQEWEGISLGTKALSHYKVKYAKLKSVK